MAVGLWLSGNQMKTQLFNYKEVNLASCKRKPRSSLQIWSLSYMNAAVGKKCVRDQKTRSNTRIDLLGMQHTKYLDSEGEERGWEM